MESINRNAFGINAELEEIVRLEEHSLTYPAGSLPVYRMTFSHEPATAYFVTEKHLQTFRSSIFTRLGAATSSLHEFVPVQLLTGSNQVRHRMLIICSIIALVGTVIGLLLTLPQRRTSRE